MSSLQAVAAATKQGCEHGTTAVDTSTEAPASWQTVLQRVEHAAIQTARAVEKTAAAPGPAIPL